MRELVKRLGRKVFHLLFGVVKRCNVVSMGLTAVPSSGIGGTVRRIARFVGTICAVPNALRFQHVHRLIGPYWRIVFVGSQAGKREVVHLFFGEELDYETRDRVAPWYISKRVREWLKSDLDLIIHESLPHFWPRRYDVPLEFTIPTWINQTLALPDKAEALIEGKSNSDKRRLINKCLKDGYKARVSTSYEDLKYIYENFYVPNLKRRFGSRALLTPFGEHKRLLRRGGLILVTRHDVVVGGKLFFLDSDTFVNNDAGLSQEGPPHWQRAGNSVIDWYCIQQAYKHGSKFISMGGTRGWQSDGIFWYKSQWGAKVERHPAIMPQWTILGVDPPPLLKDRVNEIGFITEIKNQFYRVYLNDDAASLAKEDLDRLLSHAVRRGLDGIAVMACGSKPRLHINSISTLSKAEAVKP